MGYESKNIDIAMRNKYNVAPTLAKILNALLDFVFIFLLFMLGYCIILIY